MLWMKILILRTIGKYTGNKRTVTFFPAHRTCFLKPKISYINLKKQNNKKQKTQRSPNIQKDSSCDEENRKGNHDVMGNRPDKERQIIHFLTSEESRFKCFCMWSQIRKEDTDMKKILGRKNDATSVTGKQKGAMWKRKGISKMGQTDEED